MDVGCGVCDVFQPHDRNPHGYVAIALHDVNGDGGRSTSFIQQYEAHGLPVVFPQTGHSWWADELVSAFDRQMTPMRFVTESVVNWIDETWKSVPPQLALLGIGMGGQGALRISYKFPNVFPVVAAISPDLDFHLRIREGDEILYAMYGDTESARQDTPILHIHPLNWPRHQFFCCDPDDWQIYQGVDRLRMKLSSIGIPFEIDVTKPPSVRGSYVDQMAETTLEFLMTRLDKERLRVP